MNSALLVAIVAGLVGGVLSPLVVEGIRRRHREKSWAAPRKALLRKMLKNEKWKIRSLSWLTTVTGTGEDECRTLLIEIGARGTKMNDGSEGWALIERLPLTMFDEKEDTTE